MITLKVKLDLALWIIESSQNTTQVVSHFI